MNKYINEHGKECWEGVSVDSPFSKELFHEVLMRNDPNFGYDDNYQQAFHSELGSITVLDRRTGFGWRDVETGYRDADGQFWLASGKCNVINSDCNTVGEAIEWVKRYANTCTGE